MDTIGQSNFLQALGWAVLNSLWQMALLWIIYQAITALFKTARPAHKSSLATLLLASGFSWFVYTFLSILSNASSPENIAGGFVSIDGNQQLNDWLYRTLPLASILYLALLVFPLLHFIRNYRFVQVIRHHGLSKAGVEWRMFVRRVSAQMGIKKPVHIWVSELVSSPVTIGYIKPIILLPLAAINHLTPQQLEAVLLHELAHIKRYDYFINLFIKLVQAILYFNPFVKAFVTIIEREREKSCDEMVMQFQYDPHGYATALLVLEKTNHFPKPLAVAAGGKRNDLLHRIEWIMGVDKKPVISFNKLAGLFAGLLCIIALNALVILSKPGNNSRSSMAFSDITSPYFFTDDEKNSGKEKKETSAEYEVLNEPEDLSSKETEHVVYNHAKPENNSSSASAAMEGSDEPTRELSIYQAMVHPLASYASFLNIPKLKPLEEKQVEEAMIASKKVMQEVQWKEMETNIAEVLTEKQKEELKSVYQKEFSKMDWQVLENKLRLDYDQMDWDRLNAELRKAVSNIQLDSLREVYSKAMVSLAEVEKELRQNNLCGIPDTDVTVQSLQIQTNELQKALNKLNKVKVKKIIHL